VFHTKIVSVCAYDLRSYQISFS